MSDAPSPVRAMREWAFTTGHDYAEPFTGVTVTATFTGPDGTESEIDAFHDGEATWRLRFNPGVAGRWTWRLASMPPNPDFDREGTFVVDGTGGRGFWRSTPGQGWGFADESGEPVFVLGDTVYHLFGMAHDAGVGADAVRAFMERRAEQGFNLFRIRLPVSPFHMPDGHNTWQTGSLWAWGGSAQLPRFDRFNLGYFRTVDRVMGWAEELGIGVEMIMEGWGNEFPFNRRDAFVAEWEELWLRYLIARYDAFGSVAFWTLQNEYEYYPDGDWRYASVAPSCDRWAIRVARLVRRHAPHGHIVAIHNGPRVPPLAERFASDPAVIDTIMFQDWGTTNADEGWLAAGLEGQIDQSLAGWPGSAILSEYGYEFNPDLPPLMLSHQHCGPDHTRRGAWRGAMRGLGIIHGFENSWGPFAILDQDQPGLPFLLHLRRFFTEIVPFAGLRPVDGVAQGADDRSGYAPLALATPERDVTVVYLPAGGEVSLDMDVSSLTAEWFDPRTGEISPATSPADATFTPPEPPTSDRPDDWVLVLRGGT